MAFALGAILLTYVWLGATAILAGTRNLHPNIPHRLLQMIEQWRIKNPRLVDFLARRYGISMAQVESNLNSHAHGRISDLGSNGSLLSASLRGNPGLNYTHPRTPSQSLNTNFWIPNNTVNSVLVDDAHDRVYIGGDFTYLGPYTGPLGKLDATTGIHDPSIPVITSGGSPGSIDALVPDGSGGFFVGGFFDHIGNTAVNNMAHIRSDGTVVETFNPDPDDEVEAIAFNGPDLIVGGFFSNIGGGSRQCIAEIDTSTGNIVSSWTPPSIGGWSNNGVNIVLVYGGKVYFAGYFTTVGDSTRYGVAALDAASGSVTAWNPNPTDSDLLNYFASFDAANGSIYAGGLNTSSEFPLIYKIDTTYGNQDAGWNPQVLLVNSDYGWINQVKIIGGKLCVAGEFAGFGSTTQYGFAALDTATAAITSWNAGVDSADEVTSFDVHGNEIFFGGGFTSIGGESRGYIAASDTNGNLLSWSPNADEDVHGIVYSNGSVYASASYSFNGKVRNCVASFVESTGQLTDFSVGLDGANDQLITIALHDTTLYAGGVFQSAGGESRNALAAFSINTGSVLPFDAALVAPPWSFYSGSPDVFALKIYGNNLYVGGQFEGSGDSTRNNLASFDLSTGEITSWNPDAYGSPQPSIAAMDAGGGKIYFGGEFVNVGDSTRTHLAAVDTIAGNATSWNPVLADPPYNDDNFSVQALTLDGSTIYVGGGFYSVNGQQDSSIAAIDTSSTGTLLSWNPHLDAYPQSIAVTGSMVYLGGWFTQIDGQTFNYAGTVDKVTGLPEASWNLNVDGPVFAIGISPQYRLVYVGGRSETGVLGSFSPHFAAVTNPEDASLPVQVTDFLATTDIGSVTLSWKTQSEINNAGFNVLRKDPGTTSFGLVSNYGTNDGLRGLGTSSTGRSYAFTDNKVTSGETYTYKIQSVSTDGTTRDLNSLQATVGVPREYALYQNYPNPFNPSTTIRFDLKEQSTVALDIYNVLGERVMEENHGTMSAGRFNEIVNMDRFASGVYLYRISATGNDGQKFEAIKKLMLLK